MSIFELFVIAVALSMDAFAVAVCKGLSLQKIKPKHALICGAYFGAFQAGMPIIGFYLANIFKGRIESIANYIAFALLVIIGANMLREAFSKDEEEDENPDMSVKTMIPLAVATSIDALVVGVSFAMVFTDEQKSKIWYAVAFIGVVTFVLSALGVKVGSIFGDKYKKRAEIAGGVILILMGVKVLLEQFGIL